MAAPAHRHFDDELLELRRQLLDMSSRAVEALRHAVDAVLSRDSDAAEAVIVADREIDALEMAVDDTVTTLLALQQPVATDLRSIIATLKISNDLERVGDHAVNIAQCAKRLADAPPITPGPELVEMATTARQMLQRALEAFVRSDAEASRDVCRQDDVVDALNRAVFRILVTHMTEDPQTVEAALELFLVSRNLERVGDLATNVAEEVVFLVEGKNIKHHAEDRPAGQKGEEAG